MNKAATGLHYGASPSVEHVTLAVQQAIHNLGQQAISSVLLFLTPGYAFEPQAAIREAAKCAGTLQVFGCCAVGLITEQEWVLDAEGASAMVFSQDAGLQALSVLEQQGHLVEQVFTLSSPNALDIALNSAGRAAYGAVVTDEYGHGPFSLWQSGQIVEREYCHLAFTPKQPIEVIRADAIEAISAPLQLNKANHFTLEQIELEPALTSLSRYQQEVGEVLCAVSNSNDPAFIRHGDFELFHVVGGDAEMGTVSLSGSVRAGRYLVWARREPKTAEENFQRELEAFSASKSSRPEFALMFSNISRGPEFFGGQDRDLSHFQQVFPNTPLLGFYSNAEISPNTELNLGVCHHHSALLAFGV